MFHLRLYQSKNLDEIRAHLRAGIRSVLWQSPTGSGKTASTAFMLANAAKRGHRAFFMVHRRELILQSHRAFQMAGVPHGILAAGFDIALRRPVQIASVQTLVRRLNRVQAPDLIVWDECHHLAAGSWEKIYRAFPDAVHIGLTATPERLDGRGLAPYFERMVLGPTVAELIAGGYLAPYRLFAPSTPDLAGVHTRMGDFAQNELADVMRKPRIVGDAVEHYRRLAPGKRALLFAVSIEASCICVEAFNRAGIRAEHVDAKTPDDERDAALDRLKRAETLVLSNVDLFGEGVDVPALDALIDLAPTQSVGRWLQRVGRVLRPCEGKSEALILDHAGNCQRHGLPDDPREWTLQGHAEGASRAAKQEVAIRQCAACAAVSPAFMAVCRECKTPFPVKPRSVEEIAGDLHEVTAAELRRQAVKEQAMARDLDSLIALGAMRGYRDPKGWAQHVIEAREQKQRRRA